MLLGPARHYDVQVEGDTFALTRGRARRVKVHGEDVHLAPAETLDTLDFAAEDVSFDMQARRLQHIGRAEFTGTIRQGHLDQYLAQNRPELVVTLRSGDVEARLPIVAGPLRTTATVSGSLTPTAPGANTLNFVADRARLSFLPVPAFLVNRALEVVNPVVDLSQAKVPIALQSVDVVNEVVVLHGTADLDRLTPPVTPSP